MAEPRSVDLSVVGVVNGFPLHGAGKLGVNPTAGTKDGTITYQSTPGGVTVGPDCTVVSTGRCFVGARPLGRKPFPGPLELLGKEFVSMRVVRIGRYGAVSISERGSRTGSTLRSELTTVGDYRGPRVHEMGPLQESISVSKECILTSVGRYSLIPTRGPPIPVTYVHYYRPAHPDRRRFAALDGARFLLRAKISTSVRGKALRYHSESTIRRVETR